MSKILTDNIIAPLKSKIPNLPITTNQIADGAVTAPKADVAGIMNSAGDNGQLFGLGGKAIDMGNANFNDYPWVTGFFMGHDGNNQPPKQVQPNNNWWYVEQIVHNNSYGVQIARSFFDQGAVYQRVKSGGTWTPWEQMMSSAYMLNQSYPLGSVFISLTLSTPAQVTAALGGGTWIRKFGGQAIVGVDESQTEFRAANSSGGEKYVTLTTAEIPAHTHTERVGWSNTPAAGNIIYSGFGNSNLAVDKGTAGGSTGGGQAHSNLQPYATAYIYQRTA